MFSFNPLGDIMTGWAKKQYTRDDESTIFCTNQEKKHEIYHVCIECPNPSLALALLHYYAVDAKNINAMSRLAKFAIKTKPRFSDRGNGLF
jgi:hypothetical protein